MTIKSLKDQIQELKVLIENQKTIDLNQKTVLTVDEVIAYTSIPKGTLDKLTSNFQIPFYKQGRRRFFNKEEIDRWLQSNPRNISL